MNFHWAAGAPVAGFGADTFSVRWTGEVVPQFSETYTFYTSSDDGVRLWVDNRQIVNNWTDHGYYESRYGMTVEQALDRFAAANLAIQAGLLSDDSCCSSYPWIDFESAMTRAQASRISWLWWDWHNPYDSASYHITTNGRFGSWKSLPAHPYQPNHGFQVAVNHAASVQKTSFKTNYMRTRSCN